MQLRLTIELVPRPCWYSNMRNVVPRSFWDALRKQVYAQYNYQCGVCQAGRPLHCHEIWHYDDDTHIQLLQGFIALCEWCHHIKHLGLAGILAKEGKLDYHRVVVHFLTVNDCHLEDFESHRQQAFAQWRTRNYYEWKTDLGAHSNLVPHSKREEG
ncbi:HNH endonuclease [Tengunoibacter tsumagoiensis]|nr:HNH endonuclease [Tengunoibacter tsumagoiensis]